MSEVRIIAAGPVGSGKSALLGEIEIALKAIGIPVVYSEPTQAQSEKAMTHADWASELERTQPNVVLVEWGTNVGKEPAAKSDAPPRPEPVCTYPDCECPRDPVTRRVECKMISREEEP